MTKVGLFSKISTIRMTSMDLGGVCVCVCMCVCLCEICYETELFYLLNLQISFCEIFYSVVIVSIYRRSE